jgi:hypothetical protein
MAKRSALAALDAAIKYSQVNGPKRSWFSRLPKEAQHDFAEIKSRHIAGHYQGVAFSTIHKAVVARCKEEGWPEPKSESTIERWLRP